MCRKRLTDCHRMNQSLCMAVVKLYLSDHRSRHSIWTERVLGVVSFTKDYSRKSYFIQIFDMDHVQQVRVKHPWRAQNMSMFLKQYRLTTDLHA